jgi:hypothetical protein
MCGIREFRHCLVMPIIVSFNAISNAHSYSLHLRDISVELASPLL